MGTSAAGKFRRSAMMPATERALGRLARRLSRSPGKRGLVCVSGGSDSMALLRLLLERRERDGLELSVLHFDHGLRPNASAGASQYEADWVGGQVALHGLPFYCERPVRPLQTRPQAEAPNFSSEEEPSNLQARARRWRRQCCRFWREKLAADWVALAHQQDDQHETMLMQWLRGVHWTHWRGIRTFSAALLASAAGVFARRVAGLSSQCGAGVAHRSEQQRSALFAQSRAA